MSVSPAPHPDANRAVEEARRRLGRVGAGLAAPAGPVEVWQRELARVEQLGYGSVWSNEVPPPLGTRDAFADLGVMLAATDRLLVGCGIANIWSRHAAMMQGGAATLADAYPGRLVLGVGVSMKSLVEQGGRSFGKPLATMGEYLTEMDAAAGSGPQPSVPFPRIVAALGPRMLALAGERADGAHPANMPVEHTARAREILGPDKLLIPGVVAFLDADRARGRDAARQSPMIRMPGSPYLSNYHRLGFTDADLADGGSDRFLDAAFATGDESAVAARVKEHLDAGADHVVVHPYGERSAVLGQLERLAPAVFGDRSDH